MRFNIVAFDNGVGNSRDVVLMRTALESLGLEVTLTPVGRQQRRYRRSPLLRTAGVLTRRWRQPRFDCNVMLEHVWPQALGLARHNIVVPNPEWFDRADQQALRLVDAIWTKTRYAERIFAAPGRNTQYVGFDSVDQFLPEVPRRLRCLHLAGRSRMKGTVRLLESWHAHPEWPPLTVLYSRAGVFAPLPAANIEYRDEYLDEGQVKELLNACWLHICTSETEGWGHYISEALGVGAVVVATDAPPMNELVGRDRGILVDCQANGRQHLAELFQFSVSDFARQLGQLIVSPEDRLRELGAAARAWFLANKRSFPERLAAAIRKL